MRKYEHKRKFDIKFCDVDFKDTLKVSTLLAYLEEVACSSAEELGFGYNYVKGRGYAFMVSNICCEFHKPVTLGEEVIVKTWPTPPTHVIFGREYQVLSKRKVPLVSASSRWCLIDMSNGKILQSKMIDNQNYSTYNKTKLLEDVQWKIPVFPKEEGEEKFSLKIANSEYDHNMHVNNTKYADYCFNCFTVEELAGLSLKRFMITYVKQCKEGDNLVFYRKEQGEGEYLVQGFNGKNELVVQSRIYFDKGAETI